MTEPQSLNLPEILAAHAQWRDQPATGRRADLRGADLRGAYLLNADLRGAALAQPEGEGPSERIISIAKAVQECAFSWEPDARLIGNVCAEDVADLCAALRAAADHVVPEAPDSGDAWFLYNKGAEDRQQLVRFRLLAIAAELEGPNA